MVDGHSGPKQARKQQLQRQLLPPLSADHGSVMELFAMIFSANFSLNPSVNLHI